MNFSYGFGSSTLSSKFLYILNCHPSRLQISTYYYLFKILNSEFKFDYKNTQREFKKQTQNMCAEEKTRQFIVNVYESAMIIPYY